MTSRDLSQDTALAHEAEMSTALEVERLGPWFHNLHLPDGTQTAPDHFLGDFPAFKWRQIAPQLPKDLSGWTALDIGCNAGFYSFELARRGARVTALDHDPHYLEQARWAARRFELADRIRFEQRTVYDLARMAGSYDLVLFLGDNGTHPSVTSQFKGSAYQGGWWGYVSKDLRRLLDHFQQNGFKVHAVHVPMQWPAGFLQSLPHAQAIHQIKSAPLEDPAKWAMTWRAYRRKIIENPLGGEEDKLDWQRRWLCWLMRRLRFSAAFIRKQLPSVAVAMDMLALAFLLKSLNLFAPEWVRDDGIAVPVNRVSFHLDGYPIARQ